MLGNTLLQRLAVKKVNRYKLGQLIIAAILFTQSSVALYSQQLVQPGVTDLMPEGVTTALTDICVSANSQTLAGVGFYGKVYSFDISKAGSIATQWKINNLAGFTNGGRIWFSANNQYLLLQGLQQ